MNEQKGTILVTGTSGKIGYPLAKRLAAHNDHILGALVVTVAIVAFAEVTRAARFINIALALGIIVLPWLLGGGTLAASLNDLIIGVLVIVLSIAPGKIKNSYDSWNPLVV